MGTHDQVLDFAMRSCGPLRSRSVSNGSYLGLVS
jgi:hypothetical protein